MDAIFDAIVYIAEFIGEGIYDFVVEVFAQLMVWVVIFWIKIKIFTLTFFWDVASAMLQTIGISNYINAAWGNLDSEFLSFITRYNVPEALNMIIQALLTKFVMRMVGI